MHPSASVRTAPLARSFRGIEAVDLDRPLRIRLGKWQLPLRPTVELILEQVEECVRPATESKDTRRQPTGLDADRERCGRLRFGNEHQRVASGQPSDRAELVTAEEYGVRADAKTRELLEQPVRRVRLVGEADLDVLHVARHARIAETGVPRRRFGERCDDGQPVESRSRQPALDRGEQLVDPSLWRVHPFRFRDKVDLPPVQPVGDDRRPQPTLGQPRDRCVSGSGERFVLLGRRDAPMDGHRAVPTDREHL